VTTSAAPAPAPIEFGALFTRSWELFKRNWIVALPPIVAGFLAIVVIGAFTVAAAVGAVATNAAHNAWRDYAEWAIGCSLVVFLLLVVIGLWAQIATYAMADAAWARGTTTFDDAFAAFWSRAGAVLVAWIGTAGVAVLALILVLPTLGLSMIGLTLVTMYVLPAAIAGKRGGFEAIGESFTLIRRFFVPSLVTWLGLYAIQYGLTFLIYGAIVPLQISVPTWSNSAMQMPPFPLLALSGGSFGIFALALFAYVGFSAIVQVGLYRDLSAQPELPPPVQTTLPPTAPTT